MLHSTNGAHTIQKWYIQGKGLGQTENVTFNKQGSDKLKMLHSTNKAQTTENVTFNKQGSDKLKMLHSTKKAQTN